MVAFEVSDLRLDRTASFATLLLSPRQPPRAAASDVDRGVSLVIVTAVALVHKRVADRDARELLGSCLLYTSPSPRDQRGSRMPSSA